MKKVLSFAIALSVVASAAVASAAGPSFFKSSRDLKKIAPGQPGYLVSYQGTPTPIAVVAPPPAPGVGGTSVHAPAPAGHAQHAGLFPCVEVEDCDHIAPCAVPKIVCIVDPCWKPSKCGCCAPQKPRCVQVKICVPPCGCPRVKVSKDGRKVKYDYGKYEVELESKNGKVYIDYDH
ncbi:MAG: hypothetical protein Tsb009_29420 [Planctomycetaceae bacterium]